MKIEELRIGNLVRQGRIIELRANSARVVYVRPDTNVEASALVRYDDLEVFPLTAAWLLKFGFEYLDGLRDSYILNGFEVYGSPFKSGYQLEQIFSIELPGDAMDRCPAIKYVHQLQNLYFTLTGQELTINTLSEGK